MSTSRTQTGPEQTITTSRGSDLFARYFDQVFEDASIVDDMPTGATIFMIPDNDPEHAERQITHGTAEVRRGTNGYFCHISLAPDGRVTIVSEPDGPAGTGNGDGELDDLPSGSTLVFLPDDDPELAEANIHIGIQALRRGENVYFCHVRRSPDGRLIFKTPAPVEAEEDGVAER